MNCVQQFWTTGIVSEAAVNDLNVRSWLVPFKVTHHDETICKYSINLRSSSPLINQYLSFFSSWRSLCHSLTELTQNKWQWPRPLGFAMRLCFNGLNTDNLLSELIDILVKLQCSRKTAFNNLLASKIVFYSRCSAQRNSASQASSTTKLTVFLQFTILTFNHTDKSRSCSWCERYLTLNSPHFFFSHSSSLTHMT